MSVRQMFYPLDHASAREVGFETVHPREDVGISKDLSGGA